MIFSLRDNDPPIIRGTCEKKRPLEGAYNDRATKRGAPEKRVSLIPPSTAFVLRAHLEREPMRRRFFRWFRSFNKRAAPLAKTPATRPAALNIKNTRD